MNPAKRGSNLDKKAAEPKKLVSLVCLVSRKYETPPNKSREWMELLVLIRLVELSPNMD